MKRQLLAALALGFIATTASATAQFPDQIRINGKVEMLHSNPFTPYANRPEVQAVLAPYTQGSMCSANWRGHLAAWVIRDDQLYLEGLTARPCDPKPVSIPLDAIFPNQTGPVLADWFTGQLTVPTGKLVEYVHMGYESRYERYLLIDVKAGQIQSMREANSPKPAP